MAVGDSCGRLREQDFREGATEKGPFEENLEEVRKQAVQPLQKSVPRGRATAPQLLRTKEASEEGGQGGL